MARKYLYYALKNRAKWEKKGNAVSAEIIHVVDVEANNQQQTNSSNQQQFGDLVVVQTKKAKKQQADRLVLLLHTSKCDLGPLCKTKFCSQMVSLWKHMKKCRGKNCRTSHCRSSRIVLDHFKTCKAEGKQMQCEVCSPVMETIKLDSLLKDQMQQIPAFGDNRFSDHLSSMLQQQLQQQQQFLQQLQRNTNLLKDQMQTVPSFGDDRSSDYLSSMLQQQLRQQQQFLRQLQRNNNMINQQQMSIANGNLLSQITPKTGINSRQLSRQSSLKRQLLPDGPKTNNLPLGKGVSGISYSASIGTNMSTTFNYSSTSHQGINNYGVSSSITPLEDQPTAERKKKARQQQQQRLLLLHHARKCKLGPACKTEFCAQMVTLWEHMKQCRVKYCPSPHCLGSRCVLNHHKICKSEGKARTCEICSPVLEQIRLESLVKPATDGLNAHGDKANASTSGTKKVQQLPQPQSLSQPQLPQPPKVSATATINGSSQRYFYESSEKE